ncbi:MAG: TetR family transcriptional regulator, partial [Mesorhizobium sp.]
MLETVTHMKTAEATDNEAQSAPKGDAEKRGRKASKEVRRLQLIEATMADVADGAGLSRGIVNFHFESKEKLLIATLQHMYDEYSAHWRTALQKAGDDPARQLQQLVWADFDRSICNKRKLAAWLAFWG